MKKFWKSLQLFSFITLVLLGVSSSFISLGEDEVDVPGINMVKPGYMAGSEDPGRGGIGILTTGDDTASEDDQGEDETGDVNEEVNPIFGLFADPGGGDVG